MKRKGFTLVEMLAVIVILGLIMIITFPKILEVISRQEGQIDTAEEKMIFSAVETYLSENQNFYPPRANKKYCIKVNELEQEGYLSIDADDIDLTQVVVVNYANDNDNKYTTKLQKECPEDSDEKQTNELSGLSCSVSPSGYAVEKIVTISYPLKTSNNLAYCYSDDNGSTWTEVKTFNQGQINGKGVQQFTYKEDKTLIAKVVKGEGCNNPNLESVTCEAKVTDIDSTKIGTVVDLVEDKIGKGYLKTDGTSVPRALYQKLYDNMAPGLAEPPTNSREFYLPNIGNSMIKYQ